MRTLRLAAAGLFLFLSACATAPRIEPPPPVVLRPPPARPAVVACPDCGHIERVEMVGNVRATSSGHAVLGGVVGGVVSGQPATPASTSKPGVQVLTFRIGVRMDDGRRLVLHQSELASGLHEGSRIRVANNHVLPMR